VDPLSHFAELVNRPEPEVPLDEAALAIAAQARPPVDLAAELGRLDDLAARCGEPSVDRLMEFLFVEEGFRGDVETYSDPRNSFLPDVLDRRLGIPISLSVLAIEVGRRVGVALRGVGMPGHFLLRLADPGDGPGFLDPFAGGVRLDEAGCAARFRAVVGAGPPWDPAFLAPVGTREILARMLANLRQHYVAVADPVALAWIVRWRTAIPGVSPGELAAVADLLARRALFREAATLLETNGQTVEAVRFRARLN
jgi:regulator of sirC expression with transglutaminase-like and TPR domain